MKQFLYEVWIFSASGLCVTSALILLFGHAYPGSIAGMLWRYVMIG